MLLRFDTIARTHDFDDLAATMHLRPWQWRFLLAADGQTQLNDLAHDCGIEFETAADLVHETEALGLIEIVTQTLEAYRAMHASVASPPAAELVVVAPQAEPTIAPMAAPMAAPIKKLSVSFDALSSMFGESAPIAAAFNAAHLDDAPYAFETPDHLAPHDDHASPGDAPAESLHHTHEAPVVDAAPVEAEQAAAKSVSFSLFATTFGSPKATIAPIAHEPEFASDLRGDAHRDVPTNGHATIAEIPHEPVIEHDVVHDRANAATYDYVAPDDHDVSAPHEHVTDPAPEIAHVAARTMPEDNVLLQHYQVGENAAPSAPTPEDDGVKSNGDLTGSLLRALGLKK